MNEIKFNKDETALIVRKIQLYFQEELQQDIGRFDAEFLLDFFSKEIGTFFYNRGLADAQATITHQLEEINDAIYQLELPTEFRR